MHGYIQWRESWLLYIDDMDREHQELVRLFNTLAQHLCDAASSQTPKTPPERKDHVIIALINKIGRFTKAHFANEEDRMLEAAYPDFEIHRYEHVTLLAEFAELTRELRARGPECLDPDTMDALKGWLIGHIAGADARFGEFYHQTRAGLGTSAADEFSSYWTLRTQDQ